MKMKDLIYNRDQILKNISALEALAGKMFNHPDLVKEMFGKDAPVTSSFDVTGAASYLKDYAKLLTDIIDNTEVDWPPAVINKAR